MIPKYKLLHEFELTFIADPTLIRIVLQQADGKRFD